VGPSGPDASCWCGAEASSRRLHLRRTSTLAASSTRSCVLTTNEKSSRTTDPLSSQGAGACDRAAHSDPRPREATLPERESPPREDRNAGPPETAARANCSSQPRPTGSASPRSPRAYPRSRAARGSLPSRCPAGITITQPAEYRSVRITHLRQLCERTPEAEAQHLGSGSFLSSVYCATALHAVDGLLPPGQRDGARAEWRASENAAVVASLAWQAISLS
jgi:hypothetical protein